MAVKFFWVQSLFGRFSLSSFLFSCTEMQLQICKQLSCWLTMFLLVCRLKLNKILHTPTKKCRSNYCGMQCFIFFILNMLPNIEEDFSHTRTLFSLWEYWKIYDAISLSMNNYFMQLKLVYSKTLSFLYKRISCFNYFVTLKLVHFELHGNFILF